MTEEELRQCNERLTKVVNERRLNYVGLLYGDGKVVLDGDFSADDLLAVANAICLPTNLLRTEQS